MSQRCCICSTSSRRRSQVATSSRRGIARRAGAPLAVRLGDGGALLAEPQWYPIWEELVATLSVEQLFSIYGVFELARTTLPEGVSPFGPVWAFLADRHSFRPAGHEVVE